MLCSLRLKIRRKSKNFAYFNNYCIIYTINLLVSSLLANHLLLLFVHIVVVWEEREREIDQFIFSQALDGRRERERGRGEDRLICNFVVVSRVRKSVSEHMHAYTYSMRLEENETFSFAPLFFFLFNM